MIDMKRYRIRNYSPIWWAMRIGVAIVIALAVAGGSFVITSLAASDEAGQAVIEKVYDVPLDAKLQSFIITECENNHIEPAVFFAMIEQESQYNAGAIGDNHKSFGLLQIQPRWHKDRMTKLGCNNLFDPYQNVKVGINYLSELNAKYNNIDMAVTAYNAGSYGAYKKYFSKGVYQSSYTKSVMEKAERLKGVEI